jgi:hypothetical protein
VNKQSARSKKTELTHGNSHKAPDSVYQINTQQTPEAPISEVHDFEDGYIQISARLGIDPESVREIWPDGPSSALLKLQLEFDKFNEELKNINIGKGALKTNSGQKISSRANKEKLTGDKTLLTKPYGYRDESIEEKLNKLKASRKREGSIPQAHTPKLSDQAKSNLKGLSYSKSFTNRRAQSNATKSGTKEKSGDTPNVEVTVKDDRTQDSELNAERKSEEGDQKRAKFVLEQQRENQIYEDTILRLRRAIYG